MYKVSMGKTEKEILLELLKLMSQADGNVTHDEMEMIYQLKVVYKIKDYKYRNYTKDDIRRHLEEMEEKDVCNLLTHAILLALEDGTFSPSEQNLVRSFFDLVSLENAGKMQKLINEFAKSKFDIKELLTNPSDKEIYTESIGMLNDFSTKNAEDIDERLLMKMQKGPIKKVWSQVMKLWIIVNDPKNNKASKAIAIGALLYLIFPMDAIPDIVPMLGLTDDVAMVTLALSKLTKHFGVKYRA